MLKRAEARAPERGIYAASLLDNQAMSKNFCAGILLRSFTATPATPMNGGQNCR